MRKLLSACLVTFILSCGAPAQEGPSLSQLRGDFRQVAVVARVRVDDFRLVSPGPHQLYLLRGEVLEPFKGRLRRGQPLEFYLALEDDFDVKKRLGDWVVFLEGSSNTPDKKWGWFALENSSLPYSKRLVSTLRRIRAGRRK